MLCVCPPKVHIADMAQLDWMPLPCMDPGCSPPHPPMCHILYIISPVNKTVNFTKVPTVPACTLSCSQKCTVDTEYIIYLNSKYFNSSSKAAWSRGVKFSTGVRVCEFATCSHSLDDFHVRCYLTFPPGWGVTVGWGRIGSSLGGSWQRAGLLEELRHLRENVPAAQAPQNLSECIWRLWVWWLMRLTLNFQYPGMEIIVPEVTLYNRNNVASW